MYQHILIPTDGSELAHKADVHGLALVKAAGAKVTVLTVEALNVEDASNSRIEQAQEHAASILDVIASEARAAGVTCETLQLVQLSPEMAIVNTAKERAAISSRWLRTEEPVSQQYYSAASWH
jgi:nucleotide-binding universal stress UspA family protein